MTLIYDSLAVQIVDRTTRKKGLDEKLKTFFANKFMMRSTTCRTIRAASTLSRSITATVWERPSGAESGGP
jgi:hypothetical protein